MVDQNIPEASLSSTLHSKEGPFRTAEPNTNSSFLLVKSIAGLVVSSGNLQSLI